jgi:hypothetical protein
MPRRRLRTSERPPATASETETDVAAATAPASSGPAVYPMAAALALIPKTVE